MVQSNSGFASLPLPGSTNFEDDQEHSLELGMRPCESLEPGLPRPALPCPTLPCPALSCPALPCPALPCPALPCPALPCSALPCSALPCPALPSIDLPCPALPCPVMSQVMKLPTMWVREHLKRPVRQLLFAALSGCHSAMMSCYSVLQWHVWCVQAWFCLGCQKQPYPWQ